MIPEPGRRFGPYEIQGRLGGGGMGYVFRAWDARLHREVAIKLLHNEYAMPGMRERFLREARAASALNHPHICTIFDIGEQDGDPYLVMELLEGVTLKDRIAETTMQFDEIICTAREIADGLSAAHAKGVIHRDIKPANIFLVKKPNGSYQAKMLDFGLAKIEGGVLGARGGRTVDITTAGATVGTLAYMSPEQARGEVLDSRSDLFSLGVVMYEMATRRIPFPGATSALVFVKLLNQPPPPVREWNEAIPRDLEKIIFKLMAKERTARYQTAGELEVALKQLEERGAGGGAGSWLRKAVSTVPLGRSSETSAMRERKPGRRGAGQDSRNQEVRNQEARDSSGERAEAADDAASATPQYGPSFSLSAPSAATSTSAASAEKQFLRPVARIPRRETPHPSTTVTTPAASIPQTSAPAAPAPQASAPVAAATSTHIRPLHASAQSSVGLESGPLTPAPATLNPQESISSESKSGVAAAGETAQRPSGRGVRGESGSSPARSLRVPATGARLAAAAAAAAAVEEPPSIAPGKPAGQRRKTILQHVTPKLLAGGLVLVVVLAIVTAFIVHHGRFGPTMLTETDPVVMTEIDNRTGDKVLDGSVTTALGLVLAQSPYLMLRAQEDYLLARRQVLAAGEGSELSGQSLARATARRIHAKAFFYGTLSHAEAPYELHVDLFDTDSNDVMTSVDEPVPSMSQLPATIDRVAGALRGNAGEDNDSIARTEVPLAQDATVSLEALHEFASGEDALAAGNLIEALSFDQRATQADPRFTQAQIRLAVMYRKLHAEVAAGEAAKLALAASEHASERVRAYAQYVYEVDASGDYTRAAAIMRHLLTEFPGDPMALTELARVLRFEGHMSEALQAAQQAYAADPWQADAYTQAQDALIGLDRYDAAYQTNLQAKRLGLAKGGATLASAYLEGREGAVTEALASFEEHPQNDAQNLRADWSYGIYLDNAGKLADGAALWHTDAGLAAQQDRGLASAGSFMLAQGALDRSLLGDCSGALDMARAAAHLPSGMHALFNQGMAEALCGDVSAANLAMTALRANFPQSFAVTSFYLADIQGALDLHANDPAKALETLRPATQYDLISLTAYLRGRAHVAIGQAQIGIVDFQTVLAHRGATFVIGSDVYPAAEIGVARAFAGTGDENNSSQAYRRFLDLWSDADPGQPLLAEAKQHVH